MKRKRTSWALALILMGTVVGLLAVGNSHKTYAQTFFDFGAGVRALGMGEAFTALADDESAALYNPAGLAYVSRVRLSSFYERHFGASDYLSFMGALPRFGGGLFLFDFGRIEGRDEQDNPTETFGYLQLGLLAAGGFSLNDLGLGVGAENIALGAQLRLAGTSSTPGVGGFGLALGLGALARMEPPARWPLEELRLGLMAENLGFGLIGSPGVKVGLAVRPLSELLVALDLGWPFAFHLGTEFTLPLPPPVPETALRAGLFVRGGILSFTLGWGIAWGPLALNYAFLSHPQLPGSHRLALTWRF